MTRGWLKSLIKFCKEGTPRRIRMDVGSKEISEPMRLWANVRLIEDKFAEPESPYQNGYVERIKKSYREEALDVFTTEKMGEVTGLDYVGLDLRKQATT